MVWRLGILSLTLNAEDRTQTSECDCRSCLAKALQEYRAESTDKISGAGVMH